MELSSSASKSEVAEIDELGLIAAPLAYFQLKFSLLLLADAVFFEDALENNTAYL